MKNVLKDFISQIDMVNTVNGGTSMASANVEQGETHMLIKIEAPGVGDDGFDVQVIGNELLVAAIAKTYIPENYNDKPLVPLFTRKFPLPPFADFENIEAIYENGSLVIYIPFRDIDSQDSGRHIQIRKI